MLKVAGFLQSCQLGKEKAVRKKSGSHLGFTITSWLSSSPIPIRPFAENLHLVLTYLGADMADYNDQYASDEEHFSSEENPPDEYTYYQDQ